jgi:hypothetical protein
MPARRTIFRVADALLILAFFAGIWFPLAAKALRWGTARGLHENRTLAERPSLGTTPLAALPKKTEAYFQDRFPFRADFVRWHALLRHKYLELQSGPILIGKNGWLFFDAEHCQSYDYMGQAPFSPEALARWKEYLERRRAYLAARGIHYLFVVAPNQTTIYPEMLPDTIRVKKGKTRLEQLTEFLARNSSLEIVDLGRPLREAKSRGQVYYRADTHWSGLGCYVAWGSICRRLRPWFPDIRWKPLGTDWQLKEVDAPVGLWWMLGLDPGPVPRETFLARCRPHDSTRPDVQMPSNWPAMPPGSMRPCAIETPGVRRRLLVLGDSFSFSSVTPPTERPLADYFGRSVFISSLVARNPHPQLRTIIEQERPDVVIEEVVERYLTFVPEPEAVAPCLEDGNVAAASRPVSSCMVELSKPYELRRIRLLGRADGGPAPCKVETSADGTSWAAVAEGLTIRDGVWQELEFPPTTVKHIRVAGASAARLAVAQWEAYCLPADGRLAAADKHR